MKNLGHRFTQINADFCSNTNRWLSPDSIVPDPTNPQSFNRYSYVRNSPLNFTDPSGHCESGYVDAEYDDYACWELAHSLSEKHGISVEHFGVMTLDQLQNEGYAQMLAFTLDRFSLVKSGQLTDAEATVDLLEYAIENAAGGDVETGMEYLASVISGFSFFDSDAQGYQYETILGLEEDEGFGSTGFHSDWANEGNDNQLEHFIGEAGQTILLCGGDPNCAYSLVLVNEIRPGGFDASNFWADYKLGILAVNVTIFLDNEPEQRFVVYPALEYGLQNGE